MAFRSNDRTVHCHATLLLGSGELTSRGQVDSTNLDAHVHWVLEELAAQHGPLDGESATMQCVWSSASGSEWPTLVATTLARLGALGIDLTTVIESPDA